MVSQPALRGLYGITPDGLAEAELLARVAAALTVRTADGGPALRLLQLRDKSTDPARRLRLAQALAACCRTAGTGLIINDDLPLALAVDAAGVHLGADDGDLAAARAALDAHRPSLILGASCYADLGRAERAAPFADYLAFGAVYPSPTKPQAVTAPLDLFAAARPFGKPLCAIGGITAANAAPVLAAGADLLAVVSELFGATDNDRQAPDVARRVAAFLPRFA